MDAPFVVHAAAARDEPLEDDLAVPSPQQRFVLVLHEQLNQLMDAVSALTAEQARTSARLAALEHAQRAQVPPWNVQLLGGHCVSRFCVYVKFDAAWANPDKTWRLARTLLGEGCALPAGSRIYATDISSAAVEAFVQCPEYVQLPAIAHYLERAIGETAVGRIMLAGVEAYEDAVCLKYRCQVLQDHAQGDCVVYTHDARSVVVARQPLIIVAERERVRLPGRDAWTYESSLSQWFFVVPDPPAPPQHDPHQEDAQIQG